MGGVVVGVGCGCKVSGSVCFQPQSIDLFNEPFAWNICWAGFDFFACHKFDIAAIIAGDSGDILEYVIIFVIILGIIYQLTM